MGKRGGSKLWLWGVVGRRGGHDPKTSNSKYTLNIKKWGFSVYPTTD